MVDELLAHHVVEHWVKPLAKKGDPIELLKGTIRGQAECLVKDGNYAKGCPLNNLSVEMSQIDEGFRTRIELVFRLWRDAFANVLRRGQNQGMLRGDFDPERTALFLLSVLEGVASMAKNSAASEADMGGLELLLQYIEGLRQPNTQAA